MMAPELVDTIIVRETNLEMRGEKIIIKLLLGMHT